MSYQVDTDAVIKEYYRFPYELERISDGSINRTYVVRPTSCCSSPFVLQHMHTLFAPNLMDDICSITEYLYQCGHAITPRVVRTHDGALSVLTGDSWWRALSYVPGETLHSIRSSEEAFRSGRLIGVFHSAFINYNHLFQFTIPHFHDTAYVMRMLIVKLHDQKHSAHHRALEQDARRILSAYDALGLPDTSLPKRIIHGDLKISNIRFGTHVGMPDTLIDLDTLMHGTIATELGDALRSWCASGDEDDPNLIIKHDIYRAALEGYFSTAHFLNASERASIVPGMLRVTLELAARFLIDAYEESYFAHDAKRYTTLREQNHARARNQLTLYKNMIRMRDRLHETIN